MSDLTMALKRLLADDAANLTYEEIEALIEGYAALVVERDHGNECDCYGCDVEIAVSKAFKPVDA